MKSIFTLKKLIKATFAACKTASLTSNFFLSKKIFFYLSAAQIAMLSRPLSVNLRRLPPWSGVPHRTLLVLKYLPKMYSQLATSGVHGWASSLHFYAGYSPLF